jgi:16S rRNA (guanine966-N2)-methyltransferase
MAVVPAASPAAADREAAVRIVGGRLGGRPLATPKTQAIRPTSDRLRESLFNVLTHRHRDRLVGGRVIDLFAGTGALGLEAISRGAELAVLVDDGFEARGLIRQNIEALGLGGVARLLKRDATRLGAVAPFQPFTLAFLDPPYGKGLGTRALSGLAEGGWLAPGGLAVVEEVADAAIDLPAGFALEDRRTQGETQLLFIARAG